MTERAKKGGRVRQFHPLKAVVKQVFVPEGMETEAVEAARAAIHQLWKARKEGKL